MRILLACGVKTPSAATSKPKVIDSITIKRMKLPPPYFNIIPFEQWKERDPLEEKPTSSRPRSEDVKLLKSKSSTKESLETIARNQFLLESRLKRMDTKIDKRFNKIKSFFGTLWEVLSCTASTSTQAQDPGKRPAPPTFTWSSSAEATSSGSNGGNGRGNSSDEGDEEGDDDEGDDDEEEEETASDSS